MFKNPIRERWAAGEAVANGWLSIASPFVAEIMAGQGYDAVTIDLQHGFVGVEAAGAMFQAMRGSSAALMARVPWLDPGDIMKVLDAGAHGVICPVINTPEEAARLVSYVRYPPLGVRSFGPTRAMFAAGSDYGQHADREIVCFAMIETQEAVANLDAIVATPGLDGVYIGPADLTLGLTGRTYRTGFDREEPEIVEAIRHILDKAHAAGIRAGLHNGSAEYAAGAVGWGFDLVTISNDVRLLAGAAEASLATFRRSVEGRAQAGREADASPRQIQGGY